MSEPCCFLNLVKMSFYALGNVKSKANIIFSSSLFALGLILYVVTFFVS